MTSTQPSTSALFGVLKFHCRAARAYAQVGELSKYRDAQRKAREVERIITQRARGQS